MGILMDDETLVRLSREMMDQGQAVEGGWLGCHALMLPKDATSEQVELFRRVFYCGAKCLFDALHYALENVAEPTQVDRGRLEQIRAEIDQFDAFMRERPQRTRQ